MSRLVLPEPGPAKTRCIFGRRPGLLGGVMSCPSLAFGSRAFPVLSEIWCAEHQEPSKGLAPLRRVTPPSRVRTHPPLGAPSCDHSPEDASLSGCRGDLRPVE